MAKVKVGDKVTCKVSKEAYYSNYAGAPECFFEPGEVGIVAHIDVPVVCRPKNRLGQKPAPYTFTCVDFDKPGVVLNRKTGSCVWRCSLHADNIKRV